MAGKPLPADLKKQIQKSLIKSTDMTGEQSGEVVDIIVGSIDKHSGGDGVNMEGAGKDIKNALDKQYGTSWHCVIGKGFSFEITAQHGTYLQCYYQGELSTVVFKC
jgi:dynein light chain 4